jgi:lysophospholipase L1-like esterase
MNRLLIIALAAWIGIPIARAEDQGKHLFILAGQSNMANLDPDESFLPALTEKIGTAELLVIKDAEADAPIHRWYKKWRSPTGGEPPAAEAGDLYERLMTQVKQIGQDQRLQTVTLIWLHGERDAELEYGGVYAAALKGLIDQMQEDLGRTDLNVVIGRINDHGLAANKPGTRLHDQWTRVRRAQVAAGEAGERRGWVDTDDLNTGADRMGKEVEDDLHLTREGYSILGKRLAEKALELLGKK